MNAAYLKMWLAAQRIIGGTYAKQKLALRYYKGGSVLEIGCSVGNISEAFAGKCDDFLGQDIDKEAIEIAKQRLPQLEFTSQDLGKINRQFDYVMIAGVLHHCDDETSLDIIRLSKQLTKPGGTLMSYDSMPVQPKASLPRKIIGAMEQGKFLRPVSELESFYRQLGIAIHHSEVYPLPAWRAWTPEIFDLAVVVSHAE